MGTGTTRALPVKVALPDTIETRTRWMAPRSQYLSKWRSRSRWWLAWRASKLTQR